MLVNAHQSYCMVLDWIRFTTTTISVYSCQITFLGEAYPVCYYRHIFRTFSPLGSPESLIRLYHTQVLPLLDYGCVLWDPHLSKHKQQLEKVQHFATRMASRQWNESAEKEFEEKMMTRYINNILKGEVVVSSGMKESIRKIDRQKLFHQCVEKFPLIYIAKLAKDIS